MKDKAKALFASFKFTRDCIIPPTFEQCQSIERTGGKKPKQKQTKNKPTTFCFNSTSEYCVEKRLKVRNTHPYLFKLKLQCVFPISNLTKLRAYEEQCFTPKPFHTKYS